MYCFRKCLKMDKEQLTAIVGFRATSQAPQMINSQIAYLSEYDSCDYFISGNCQECNACEILDILKYGANGERL